MKIELDTALRLFKEANEYEKGNAYITENSEIRAIATTTFGHSLGMHLDRVTKEIFRVIAEAHVNEVNLAR